MLFFIVTLKTKEKNWDGEFLTVKWHIHIPKKYSTQNISKVFLYLYCRSWSLQEGGGVLYLGLVTWTKELVSGSDAVTITEFKSLSLGKLYSVGSY